MKPYDTLTVIAIASIIFGSSYALHESTHAIVGSFLGAELLLVTSNSVLWGDFSAVLDRGLMLYTMSGPSIIIVTALISFGLLKKTSAKSSTARFFLFLFFTTNACIAVSYLTVGPLLGFGDWMDLAQILPNPGIARGLLTVTGALATWGLLLIVNRQFAQFVSQAPGDKVRVAFGISWTCFLTMGVLGLVAGLLSPVGLGNPTEIFLLLGQSFSACWILFLAAGRVASTEYSDSIASWVGIGPSNTWVISGVVVSAVFVFGFGLGIGP